MTSRSFNNFSDFRIDYVKLAGVGGHTFKNSLRICEGAFAPARPTKFEASLPDARGANAANGSRKSIFTSIAQAGDSGPQWSAKNQKW